jgi:hypothetical protein
MKAAGALIGLLRELRDNMGRYIDVSDCESGTEELL